MNISNENQRVAVLNAIDKNIGILNSGLDWGKKYLTESESQEFTRKMVNVRREMKKIQYALSEGCAAATFGESQMGKSYLVNSMFSEPNTPFSVKNGEKSYVFKTDINPSEAYSQIEATGVVTRFTHKQPQDVPSGYLRAQLLSISDIILILSEAYYNEVDYVAKPMSEWMEYLIDGIKNTQTNGTQDLLEEDDILDIEEYFHTHSAIRMKCGPLLDSHIGFFPFLLHNINKLSERSLTTLIKKIWNENENINRLFDNLVANYRTLHFSESLYVEFDAILKKYGTLVDVARLDEMFSENLDVRPEEYKRDTRVQLMDDKSVLTVPKSYLSALTAELTLPVILQEDNAAKEDKIDRNFFQHLDILDFPGACPDEQIKEAELCEPKKLSRVYRRGKVSYLFNKYSSAKRISTLLFCHNNHQSKFGKMGYFLTDWIENNIGNTPQARAKYIEKAGISPFFVIATWFNTDLEYADKKPGDDLNYLWQRRFNAVLSTDVLKVGTRDHWFNVWDGNKKFQNLYLLRDFDHSKMIFSGYDPDTKSKESAVVEHNKYPNFLGALRSSFIQNEFVQEHFANPGESWDSAATISNDGTIPVMESLGVLAPNISSARVEHFETEFNRLVQQLKGLLEEKYHSGDATEDIKKAKKMAGKVSLSIDTQCGKDPYFFGRLLDRLMIPESDIYQIVFDKLNGQQQAPSMSSQESQVFMSAKLCTSASREDNIERLISYLGADDENECREILSSQGIEMDALLGQNKMVLSPAELLVSSIESFWLNEFLLGVCLNRYRDVIPLFGEICEKLHAMYSNLNMHEYMVSNVNRYLSTLKLSSSTGIIADYLAMEYNRFTSSFGFDYLDEQAKKTLEKQNEEHNLGLDFRILNYKRSPQGVALLTELAEAMDALTGNGYGAHANDHQILLPQYNTVWGWQQKMRVALIYVCHIPDYDIVANDKLHAIMDNL